MIIIKNDQTADRFPITDFEGEPDRFNEDAKGLTNVGETGDPAMKPGTSMMLTVDMAEGHYAIVKNKTAYDVLALLEFRRVLFRSSTPVSATLADTSSTQMSITLSQSYA